MRQYQRDWDGGWQRQKIEGLLRQRAALSMRRLRAAVAEALPPAPFRAIELGAGGSTWLPFLAEHGAEVIGIDLSGHGLELSRRICERTGTRAHLVHGDVTQLPFEPRSFDVVLSAGLVEHFRDPVSLLTGAWRILRLGGICITTVPNKRGLPGLLDRLLHPGTFWGHIPFTPYQLAEVHRATGFAVLSARYAGCFSFGARAPESGPLRLPYRVVRRVVTGVVSSAMSLLRWYPESRAFSPSILVVGRRPAG